MSFQTDHGWWTIHNISENWISKFVYFWQIRNFWQNSPFLQYYPVRIFSNKAMGSRNYLPFVNNGSTTNMGIKIQFHSKLSSCIVMYWYNKFPIIYNNTILFFEIYTLKYKSLIPGFRYLAWYLLACACLKREAG